MTEGVQMDLLTLAQLIECSDEELDQVYAQAIDMAEVARHTGDQWLADQANMRHVHVLVARELRGAGAGA